MTKKDYEIIARILFKTRDYLDTEGIEMLIESFADSLKANYPNFNEEKFKEYAGYELED